MIKKEENSQYRIIKLQKMSRYKDQSKEVELSTSQVIGTDDVFLEEDSSYSNKLNDAKSNLSPGLKIKRINSDL